MSRSVESKYDHSFKIIITGDSFVGKSCLLGKLINDRFDIDYVRTIGVDYMSKLVKYTIGNTRLNIRMNLWDLSGRDSYKTIIRSYYKDCHGVILMYDINNKESFDNITSWINEIQNYRHDMNHITVLIGNKLDLPGVVDNFGTVHKREVSYDQGKDFAVKHGMIFYETSIKDGTHVNEMFDTLITEIHKNFKQQYERRVSVIKESDTNKSRCC